MLDSWRKGRIVLEESRKCEFRLSAMLLFWFQHQFAIVLERLDQQKPARKIVVWMAVCVLLNSSCLKNSSSGIFRGGPLCLGLFHRFPVVRFITANCSIRHFVTRYSLSQLFFQHCHCTFSSSWDSWRSPKNYWLPVFVYKSHLSGQTTVTPLFCRC